MLPYYSGNMFPPHMLPFPASNTVLNPNGIATNLGVSNVTKTNKRKRNTSTRAPNKRARQTGPAAVASAESPLSHASPHCGVGPSIEIRPLDSQEVENRDPNIGVSFLLFSKKS
jgi:hypothetical protein